MVRRLAASTAMLAALLPAAQAAAVDSVDSAAPASNRTRVTAPDENPSRAPRGGVDFRGEPASPAVREWARESFAAGDTGGRSFAIVDKRDARLYVFAPDGRLAGSAPALLGLATGDRATLGPAWRAGDRLAPAERVTPAGRFVSEPGHNARGEAIVWIDYGAALAIHRLRPAPPAERRAERLASATPDDNRISLGCVVVAGAFFDAVVAPWLGRGHGIVYVLPETGGATALQALLRAPAAPVTPALAAQAPAAAMAVTGSATQRVALREPAR